MAPSSRDMEIDTKLGADVLLFRGLYGREELGRLFEYQLDLISDDAGVKFDDILGTAVTVKLALPEGGKRFFNGYVTRIAQVGTLGRYARYAATVRPWLWFLTRTADCRIFQDMTVPDIIKKVFGDEKAADFDDKLTGKYHKWPYCVQYRETDFNFVSRLMEQEGIYYYFKHDDGRHTLVLADAPSCHDPFPGFAEIPYRDDNDDSGDDTDSVSAWEFASAIQPGIFAHDDHDFERPSVELMAKKSHSRKHEHADYEVYDFPGEYIQKPDGEQYAAARIEELAAQFEIAQAASNARGLASGCTFKLTDHTRDDQNREYLVLSASYALEYSEYESLPESADSGYRCSFECMTSKQQFRPQRTTPKPAVQGPQSAVVVGPSGDEIYTDKYGRIKVQFHWDRYGKKDENSSCWVRVSYPWAGKNFGAIHIPRITQEVLVDFLEGDPDEPIVIGRVYNAEQMPPWGLPDNKTQSGILTRSSKGGAAANANAIRFEDKKGSEQLWIHAEKNQDIEVENDETHWVGHDRTKTIDHDETTHVKHDRTETVDNNESITIGVNRTEQVGANEKIAIGANRTESVGANETISIGANRTITVSANETATVAVARTHSVGANEAIAVGGAQEIAVGAAQAVTVGAAQSINVGASQTTNVGADQSVNVGGGQTTSIGADETRSVSGARATSIAKDDSLDVGKNLSITAADSITITTGDASITMKKDGTISIKGKDITVEGSGKINVKASSDIVMKGSKITQN
ncbi:MAG TPA: type VI secretion system tip protein TssI/VgrG [Steroidobacteraceae bacterium]|nr:type VI secretion system tip protein TssI/VgrG [Steroidobacteraceae bacterium]